MTVTFFLRTNLSSKLTFGAIFANFTQIYIINNKPATSGIAGSKVGRNDHYPYGSGKKCKKRKVLVLWEAGVINL